MRVFITGATGFLGGYVAEACVELHSGDLCDRESLERGLKGCELILHTAAKVGDWWHEVESQKDTSI